MSVSSLPRWDLVRWSHCISPLTLIDQSFSGFLISMDEYSSAAMQELPPFIAGLGIGMLFHAPFQALARLLEPSDLASATSAFFLIRFTGATSGLVRHSQLQLWSSTKIFTVRGWGSFRESVTPVGHCRATPDAIRRRIKPTADIFGTVNRTSSSINKCSRLRTHCKCSPMLLCNVCLISIWHFNVVCLDYMHGMPRIRLYSKPAASMDCFSC